MRENSRTGLWIVGIVAIVAIATIIIIFTQSAAPVQEAQTCSAVDSGTPTSVAQLNVPAGKKPVIVGNDVYFVPASADAAGAAYALDDNSYAGGCHCKKKKGKCSITVYGDTVLDCSGCGDCSW